MRLSPATLRLHLHVLTTHSSPVMRTFGVGGGGEGVARYVSSEGIHAVGGGGEGRARVVDGAGWVCSAQGDSRRPNTRRYEGWYGPLQRQTTSYNCARPHGLPFRARNRMDGLLRIFALSSSKLHPARGCKHIAHLTRCARTHPLHSITHILETKCA